jgi:hypothetical protein
LLVLFCFIIVGFAFTRVGIAVVDKMHAVKNRDHYNWDEKDLRFHNKIEILKVSLACGLAALLCGLTGIAGGMILGPLFLKYGMVPMVMSSTNQYITLWASFAVFF